MPAAWQGRFDRFIPAGAGNAMSTSIWQLLTSVHPRGCGERCTSFVLPAQCDGSSPRVRGTLSTGRAGRAGLRFIPAGAGNAKCPCTTPSATPVHPRGCGERGVASDAMVGHAGSSPRVRGTQTTTNRDALGRRFIPAGAGNAAWTAARTPIRTVHPRGCGERLAVFVWFARRLGSSPRVRGTPSKLKPVVVTDRFIPAGAGNASFNNGVPDSNSVHPRGCGERAQGKSSTGTLPGSSPRVRGTRSADRCRRRRRRFIPAGAGNAVHNAGDWCRDVVHPRGCGERIPAAR